MGAGIPGTGMATLFYIVSAFLMPFRELVLVAQRRSSWARWRTIGKHLAIASAMAVSVYATFRVLPGALLPPDVSSVAVPSLLVAAVLLLGYVAVTRAAAWLVPGQLALPEPRRTVLNERRRLVLGAGKPDHRHRTHHQRARHRAPTRLRGASGGRGRSPQRQQVRPPGWRSGQLAVREGASPWQDLSLRPAD